MIFFVYKLTFANGKVYIGMSRTDKKGGIRNRYRAHENAAKNGKDLPIYHAWRKYGAPEQTILSACQSRDECAELEIVMIKNHDSMNPEKGYNLMPGGQGLHAPPGSAVYELMRAKVWNNPEVRKKLSIANKGKPPSPQTIAAAKAFYATPDGPLAVAKGWTPDRKIKASELTRAQMANGGAEHLSQTTKGRPDPRTPEGKERQRESAKRDMTPVRANTMRAAAFANPENVRKFEEGRAAWRDSAENAEHCKRIAKLSAEASMTPVVHVASGREFPSCKALAEAMGYKHQSYISRLIKQGKVLRI
jgi:hypothetical protein